MSGTSASASVPALAQRVRDCDLLLVLGSRLGAFTTGGYRLLEVPNPRQRLVQVHASSEEPGRVYRPDLAITASLASFAARLPEIDGVDPTPWRDWSRAARADYERWTEPAETPGAVKLESVLCHLRDVLPEDAIVTNGAGNYSAFVQRYYRYRAYPSQLAPTSGSMGYGLPAAIAAKLAHPRRSVVCFAGDGCFQMTGQELATAMQYGLAIIVVVANNALYGSIRMHQALHYPGRVIASELHNPDFAALARSYGAHAETVTTTEDFPRRLRAGARCGKGGPDRAPHRPRGDQPDPDATRSRSRSGRVGSELLPPTRRHARGDRGSIHCATRLEQERSPCPRPASRP